MGNDAAFLFEKETDCPAGAVGLRSAERLNVRILFRDAAFLFSPHSLHGNLTAERRIPHET